MHFTDYLLEQSGATLEQIDDLRSKAKAGGRGLLDQAYLSGLADERELLRAIRMATSIPTVELTDRRIDPTVLRLTSGRQAWALKLLPFAIKSGSNILSIACKYPADQNQLELASKLFPGHEIKLFLAIGPGLEASIIEHYRGEPLTEAASGPSLSTIETTPQPAGPESIAYLIGAQTTADRQLGQALAADGYDVIMADDWSELTEELKKTPPDLVLIRESDNSLPSKVLNQLPAELPASTVIRRYQTVAQLLDPSQDIIEHGTLAVVNLHLATEALAHTWDENRDPPVQIGSMVEKVCRQLRLAPHDHLMTVTAGYLQDIAALHFKGEGPTDRQTAYFMLQGLIDESEVYPPAVLGLIRKMYCDLSPMKPSDATSIQTRNGNVLTVVDYYMRQFSDQARITPSRFDLIDQKVRDQIGRLLLPEVAEGFLSFIRSEITHQGRTGSTNRALVLDELGLIDEGLGETLTSSNLSVSLTRSIEQFVAQYHKRNPDLIIITSGMTASLIGTLLQRLTADGVVLGAVPSFLLHTSNEGDEIARLASFGLGHSIPYRGELKILEYRLKQVADDKEQESRRRLQVLQEMGTHGSLDDMNVIDLLQSMGPSNKTLCINISGKGHHLTLFLTQGQLVHAVSAELSGVEAVYEALSWESGIWSVDHVTAEEIPEPNVQQSIDSILMQGCYLLDEMNRDQAEAQAPAPQG